MARIGEAYRLGLVAALAALFVGACAEPASTAVGQEGCSIDACHGRVEHIHYGGAALTCVDCHGGDSAAITKEAAHPTTTVSFNAATPGVEEPGGLLLAGASLAELDALDEETLMFLNPSDYRIVRQTCGSTTRGGGNCHTRIVDTTLLSTHTTLAGQIAGGLYFGGNTDREARYAVLDSEDPHPAPLPGTVPSLSILPDLVPDEESSGAAADAYYAAMGQICVTCHLARDNPHVPGLYTSSGCNACHMLTADDGRPATTDPTQDVEEGGHVERHRLTNLIPDSQCNRCHHAHLHRGLLSQGVRERSEPVGDNAIGGINHGLEDPEEAVFWGNENYVRFLGRFNLYGKPFPFYIEDEDGTNEVDETPPDIHTENGMACIDCHTMAELHGGDHMAVRREFETEVRCESCHGVPDREISRVQLPFVQASSQVGGNADNPQMVTVNEITGELQQLGKLDGQQHPLTQIARRMVPANIPYNPRMLMGCGLHAGSAAFRGHLAEWLGETEPDYVDDAFPGLPEGALLPDDVGERDGRLECFACHNAWTVNCYGCHVVRDDRQTVTNQVTGEVEAGRITNLAMSVVPDALALGINTRGRVSPMVGTSIFFTHLDSSGEILIDAEPLVTVDGMSGDGNQHNPVHHHTIRQQPRDCQGCHPRADGVVDDTEALARATGFGTDRFTFVDGEGRRHLLDRLVALDFDGDGEFDDPTAGLPAGPAVSAEPIAASTHLPVSEEAAELGGPGPLDVALINRMLTNHVVPQRPEE